MATKSYKLRLDIRANEPTVDPVRFDGRAVEVDTAQRLLEDTRNVFNAGVDYLTGWLLRMHRGAGVCREKKDGIWREWEEIGSLDKLKEAKNRHRANPDSFAVIENHDLLNAFKGKGKSETESVQLAECCRLIMAEIARPAEEGQQVQMNRSDLDLLTLADSEARGVRPKSASKDGAAKKTSGKRPGWMLDKAIGEECDCAASLNDLIQRLEKRQEFQSAKQDGKKKIEALTKKHQKFAWSEAKCAIMEPHTDGRPKWEVAKQKWEDKRRASETSGAVSAYKELLDAGCLPLPGLSRPSDHLRLTGQVAEWNYALWNMAGQRVRSHLGWARRRMRERTLWELRNSLFDRGGWIRIKRNGKAIRKSELAPQDIRFDPPPDQEKNEFENRPAYADRLWVKSLSEYETVEMPQHLESVAFSAAGQSRIRKKTAKGWGKVRGKWIDLIDKAAKAAKPEPSATDLLEAFDKMRTRKMREYGDRRLFEWLATPERRWLWDAFSEGDDNFCGRDDRDCVSAFIAHNEHLADKPESITFTRSDSVKHPVWPFFGENSAVEYRLCREPLDGKIRLILVLKQLLSKQADGSYTAVNNVRIALRGYEDFEKSFAFPSGQNEVSAKQELVFRDDLLGSTTRNGTLSGIKLTWERDELEAHRRKHHARKVTPRIYANFSCDAGEAELPEWLTKSVGSNVKLKKPRDGMTRAFFLKKAINKESPDGESNALSSPGERNWPEEAIDKGFGVRGTDLGYRTSSAGAWWRLSFQRPEGKVAWAVGKCADRDVYAILERTASVSLPGDGEALPQPEQIIRDRLYSLRTRLNLNNALMRITRLLTLVSFTQRKPNGDRLRKRADGTHKRIGTKWKTEAVNLEEAEIKENCRKAAEQLLRWSSTDAMTESLKAASSSGSLWHWLTIRDAQLDRLSQRVPETEVPTEKQAKKNGIDRDVPKQQRDRENAEFAQAVYDLRVPLAQALCDGYDASRRSRARSGLWAEFDRALLREISYSDRTDANGNPEQFDQGLFRLLRKPPTTKHQDRKDEANNLPHGQTYRGGLSMQRLNFIDDVKNLVRRWSSRPRWPGDVRRVPEDAKFDRCDTKHLDHLRENRAKLIAHADVAQTLGFEQDLRRGIWLYKQAHSRDDELWHRPERGHIYQWRGSKLSQTGENAPSHPVAVHSRAHVLIYEDLTRYKMSSDRPKNENAGLARWSHRRILSFAQHIGGLFGVPVATVDARFSSRYCSQCGAPGCRAIRFDPAWLNQAWMRKLLQSSDIQDAAMKAVAHQVREALERDAQAYDRIEDRPWVLRDGGEFFVCANEKCSAHSTPTNADQNAAANVGLRFLRGVDGVRVTISGSGLITKSIGYVRPGLKLACSDMQGEPCWQPSARRGETTRRTKLREGNAAALSDSVPTDDDDEGGGALTLFRDPSGKFRAGDRWFDGKWFWGAVKRSCAAGVNAANASQFGAESREVED